MNYEHHPQLPAPISRLGLGCSRLGSLATGRTASELHALVKGARDLGVTVFDTANIYGQGRSESLLGVALRGDKDVCLVTKAGQRFPMAQRLLSPLRGPVSAVLKRSKSAQTGVRAVRSGRQLPRDYTPEHLRRSLQASLRRLRRREVEIFLLHSPRGPHLADGSALDGLVELKRQGLARLVGVSVDDAEVLEAVAMDPRVDVIQAPFGLRRTTLAEPLAAAAARGALVIAREIFSCEPAGQRPPIGDAVAFGVSHPSVRVALVGTTNLDHLKEAVIAAER